MKVCRGCSKIPCIANIILTMHLNSSVIFSSSQECLWIVAIVKGTWGVWVTETPVKYWGVYLGVYCLVYLATGLLKSAEFYIFIVVSAK